MVFLIDVDSIHPYHPNDDPKTASYLFPIHEKLVEHKQRNNSHLAMAVVFKFSITKTMPECHDDLVSLP
jgi:hypothetical protein